MRGFTLIEVLVALASMALVSLLITVIFILAKGRYEEVRDRMAAEYEAAHAENVLRDVFSQAVDVSFSAPSFGAAQTFNIASTKGQIRDGITYAKIADMAGDWSTLAVFYREGSTASGATEAYGGKLLKTALWYRRPSATKSGVVFVSSVTPSGSASAMTPSYQDSVIDRLTYLKIVKNRAGQFDQTASLDITMRFRYFPSHSLGYNWCPQADLAAATAGCTAVTANFRDLEKTFHILLQNNLVKAGGVATQNSATLSEERTLGNLYFFKLTTPARWK